MKHQDATLVHIPYNFTFADAAARAAGTGYTIVPGDVGKLARQLDANSLWLLTDDSPITWVAVTGTPGAVSTDSIWDAKGDLAVGTGANTAAKLTVGSNGQQVKAASGEATGLKWFTGGQELIDEEVISGTGTSSITLNEGGSNISTAFRHLRIVFVARSTTTGAKGLRIRFNGDTGGNYDWELISGTDTSATVSEGNADTSGRAGSLTASDGISGGAGVGVIDIPFYHQTTFNKSAISTGGRANTTTQNTTGVEQAFWRSTAAITSITLFPDSGNFADGCIFSLYGVY